MLNFELAKILKNISLYLEMDEIAFKPQAYEKAAYSIEALKDDISEIYKNGGIKALEDIPGIGKSIAKHIEEFIKTKKIKYYEQLKKKMPVNIEELTSIEGIGPKLVKKLYKSLKIKNIKDLEKAAKAGKIRNLKNFGIKSEENILKGIEFFKKSSGRFILGFILPTIKKIEKKLKSLKEVEHIAVAGSIRRMKETIGDADILVVSSKPEKVIDYFTKIPEVSRIYAQGKTKAAIKLDNGLDVDLRVVKKESFGAALAYFTGNKEHNIAMRRIAIEHKMKLNEYGLFLKSGKMIAGKTEEEIYKALNMQYVPPEMRENWGEINLSLKHQIPKLINYGDLKGDLQIQTNWTDGLNSIEEMALAAQKMGLKYIAITDHTKSLAMTNGSDEKKLLKQMQEIDNINKNLSGIKILKGAEVNILKDGSLDIKDEILEKLDIVGAAIHSNFNMSKKEMTERIKKAMMNKNVDIIFHPTGRIIQKRPAYEIDVEEILKTAVKTKTIMEIDAYPDRLDLKDEYIKMGMELGVKFAIDSDSHNINHLQYLELGIAQARRGWLKKSDVINTYEWQEMLKMLK